MTRQARYMARRRRQWKAAGLCQVCGKEPAPGKVRGPKCTALQAKYMARRRAKQRTLPR